MSTKWTQKPQLSTTIETGKYHKTHTREQSFITSCKKDLKEKGYTICWEQWQVDEIVKSRLFDIKEIVLEDCYFIIKI